MPKRIEFLLLIFSLLLITQIGYAQVYVEKQTRHRFAQLTLGLDFQSSFGGSSKFVDASGKTSTLNLNNNYSPRFLIGGTHFWGHADFYIAIPLTTPSTVKESQEILAFRGVETVLKYYPFRIEHHKLGPYIGTSIAPFYFESKNNNFEYPSGPELNHTSFPLLGGITFNSKNHLIELGIAWNYDHRQNYYISPALAETIETPSIYTSLSYKYMLDTSIGAEKDWESGRTHEVTKILSERGDLNGFYVGAGISTAFWLRKSDYNTELRPFIEKYNTSLMPDFTLGYYVHDTDLNMAIAYRGYRTSTNSYGAIQQLKRKSILLEVTKYLFDYHGFVPFIGPAISFEKLGFAEQFQGSLTADIKENKLGYGVTFGWDIRPNRVQSWLLRTNLRWYPNLYLETEPNLKISYDNLEFNFIQLIIYPNRIL